MTDETAGEGEETVVLSRRDRRRAGAASDAAVSGAAVSEGTEEQPPADPDEATIVVDRAKPTAKPTPQAASDAEPASADDPAEPDTSSGDPDDDASDAPDGAGAAEQVDARADEPDADPLDEATVVVDRAAAPKADAPDEATVVVSRPARRLRRKRVDSADTVDSAHEKTAVTRRVESFAAPTEGPAPAIYKPRPAPLVPVAPPVVVGAAAPTRVEDPGLPSVAKQGQRWSLLTLAAAAGACVVSVVGLVALGFVVFG
ncbi:hypothetical protein RN51_02484 [Microbacterium oxydans]|uniref:Uncharacterized protein n=1 Tax=Microbacterium oxydans TaxID=82380 RepID=A0A0F0KKR9_9MICO|nr:hypothetical protein [Microbacterium oxydans]KJL21463.1 hypothetical protein RN51_02484 [Microbacterium oxydans]